MKKIVLASGVLALGLLASCSNDAPVSPDDSNVTGDYRYIAVKIAPNAATRASQTDAEVIGDDNERAIESATLYLVGDNDTVMARNFNVNFTGAGNKTATTIAFPVTPEYFEKLTANAGNGAKKYKLYLVANAEKNGFTMNVFDDDAVVEKDNWGDGDNKGRAGYFYMSNDDVIEITLPAYDATSASANGSSSATAWPINANNQIVLNRLAARFDLKIDAEPYTDDDNKGSFEVIGARLMNINSKSYLFRHMSENGKADQAVVFGREGHLVTPHADWYGKTCTPMGSIIYREGTALDEFKADEPVKFDYGFESAIEDVVTKDSPKDVIDDLVSYKNVTYMAFKAQFNYPGWTDGTKEFAVYNGEIVGTLAEMRDPDFKPTGLSDENRPYVVNTLNKLRDESKTDKGINEQTLRDNEFDYFKPEGGKYYCYYTHPLYNAIDEDNESLDYCCKYRVRRNRLYNMDLESISKIGHDGNFIPDPIIFEDTKWIKLNVQIKSWRISNNSFNF